MNEVVPRHFETTISQCGVATEENESARSLWLRQTLST
jgi:hypothetical protein